MDLTVRTIKVQNLVYTNCSALLFLNIYTQGDAYLGSMIIEVLHLELN